MKTIPNESHFPLKDIAAITCTYCEAPMFYAYPDTTCKHIGLICPQCKRPQELSLSVHRVNALTQEV